VSVLDIIQYIKSKGNTMKNPQVISHDLIKKFIDRERDGKWDGALVQLSRIITPVRDSNGFGDGFTLRVRTQEEAEALLDEVFNSKFGHLQGHARDEVEKEFSGAKEIIAQCLVPLHFSFSYGYGSRNGCMTFTVRDGAVYAPSDIHIRDIDENTTIAEIMAECHQYGQKVANSIGL